MKRTLKFIIQACLMAVTLSACIYDDEPMETDIPLAQSVQMGFTIRVGGNKPATRGTGDIVEAGNDLENMIDIENRDFRVYFYEAGNDAYIGELEIISVLDVTDNSGDGYNNDYYVVGRVDNDFVTRLNAGFHMVVMANLGKWTSMEFKNGNVYEFGKYPDAPLFTPIKDNYAQCYHYGTGLDGQNNDKTFANAKGYIVSKDRLIPMWGCQTYQVQLTENTITQLTEPVIMLRTLAKIEVNCDLEAMELSGVQKIESVAITKSRSCVRIEQLPDNNVQFDETHTDHARPNIRDIYDRVRNPIFFTEQTEEGSNIQKFVIYVPEMNDRTVNDDLQPYIQVTLGGKGFTFPVSSAGTEETRIPLLRNHIYRYTIKKIAVKPTLEYEVVNWDTHNINIGYN